MIIPSGTSRRRFIMESFQGIAALAVAAVIVVVAVLLALKLRSKRPGSRFARRKATLLHDWAASGSLRGVEEEISKGARIDAQDGKGRTPLHRGIIESNQSQRMVELLLSKGADPNIADDFGLTALHLAVVEGKYFLIEKLVSKGADLERRSSEGLTPMEEAISRGDKACIAALRRSGATHSAGSQANVDGIQISYRALDLVSGTSAAARIKSSVIPWAQSMIANGRGLDVHLSVETRTFEEWHHLNEGIESVFFEDVEVNSLFKNSIVRLTITSPEGVDESSFIVD
jgi:ankyrin repeat protein